MTQTPLLQVRGLSAGVGDSAILQGIDLTVRSGEVHAVMGPNGSGKSTLARVLAGDPTYTVTAGEAHLDGRDLLALLPEDRARGGLFLSFQHPVAIPGVRLDHFLRASFNALRKSRSEDEMDVLRFDRLLTGKVGDVEMEPGLAKRAVNEGFSGGERKRNELLQMAVLEPRLAVLDEPDSGLDVDALRSVAGVLNRMRGPDNALVLVTHYQRILSHVVPDAVHVLIDGRIVRSGGSELALEVEATGYDPFEAAVASPP